MHCNNIVNNSVEKGYSQGQIAEEFDCSESRLKYWWEKLELKSKICQHNKRKKISELNKCVLLCGHYYRLRHANDASW